MPAPPRPHATPAAVTAVTEGRADKRYAWPEDRAPNDDPVAEEERVMDRKSIVESGSTKARANERCATKATGTTEAAKMSEASATAEASHMHATTPHVHASATSRCVGRRGKGCTSCKRGDRDECDC